MKLASVHLEISFPSPVPAPRPVDELRSSRSGSATRVRENSVDNVGFTLIFGKLIWRFFTGETSSSNRRRYENGRS
jgi:hypothetical protein